MQYASVIRGQFCSRPNRFLAVVRIGGQEEIVHVKNTGRCRELLIPECTVYLSRSDNPNRKTKYDLIAVEKQREGKPPLLINLDSQIPNAAAAEWLETGSLFSANAVFRREVTPVLSGGQGRYAGTGRHCTVSGCPDTAGCQASAGADCLPAGRDSGVSATGHSNERNPCVSPQRCHAPAVWRSTPAGSSCRRYASGTGLHRHAGLHHH